MSRPRVVLLQGITAIQLAGPTRIPGAVMPAAYTKTHQDRIVANDRTGDVPGPHRSARHVSPDGLYDAYPGGPHLIALSCCWPYLIALAVRDRLVRRRIRPLRAPCFGAEQHANSFESARRMSVLAGSLRQPRGWRDLLFQAATERVKRYACRARGRPGRRDWRPANISRDSSPAHASHRARSTPGRSRVRRSRPNNRAVV
jgi:hypothetical protein